MAAEGTSSRRQPASTSTSNSSFASSSSLPASTKESAVTQRFRASEGPHLSVPKEKEDYSTEIAGEMPLNIRSPTLHRWILLALASGCFAALNGAFAKLTTTSLTSSLASSVSNALNVSPDSFLPKLIELLTRGFFFGLNLISNGIMWTLFTRALTAHSSATKVSLVNTSANFLLTAILGWAVFGEELRGLWWLGAACLVVGNLIVGRGRGEDEGKIRLEGEGDAGTGAGGVGREVAGGLDDGLEGVESVPLVNTRGSERDILVGDEEGVAPDEEMEDAVRT